MKEIEKTKGFQGTKKVVSIFEKHGEKKAFNSPKELKALFDEMADFFQAK